MRHDHKGGFDQYPQMVKDLVNDPKYFGRMNDPTCSSYLKGPCGDAMEFYFVLQDDKITEVKYYTDGCLATKACAAMAARMADGKTVEDALCITAGMVIAELKGLPGDHLHCAILSVSTLYRALADHLLRK